MYNKQTQVPDDSKCLSHDEEAKFERDGKEVGWFMLDSLHDWGKPNLLTTYCTRQIIMAKLHAENYARSNSSGSKLLVKEYAKSATEHKKNLSRQFWEDCDRNYCKDSNGRFYRKEQDEVIEVTTEKQLKARYSSCINYIFS